MSGFEIVALSLSLILGLSIAHMLGSVTQLVRSRGEVRWHWLPIAWALSIFLLHVQFWIALFHLGEMVGDWSWDWFIPVLLLAMLLFMGGSLVLPTLQRDQSHGLLDDFIEKGRVALIPTGLYLLLWIPVNVRIGADWMSSMNGLDVVLAAIASIAFQTKNSRIRSVASIVFLLLTALGVFWVWTPSGAS